MLGLGSALLGLGATAGPSDPATTWLNAHRGAVVQLRVSGKVNNQPVLEFGTGFLVQTADGPRIITAGHVVGPDNRWDSLDERCIYYRLAQSGGSLAYDCVIDAKMMQGIDAAEVFLDPFSATTLDLATTMPAEGANLYVASWRSWGHPGSRATAQPVQLRKFLSDRMILSGNYERSDSGSPVVDEQGRVVGIMIEASTADGGQTEGIALPLPTFAAEISTPTLAPLKRLSLPIFGDDPKASILVDAIERSIRGCVFLGKRSARGTNRPADMPFGAAVLASLIDDQQRNTLVGKQLKATTSVNLRADCPTIVDGSAYYAAPRVKLKPASTVVASEIRALRYLDDVFYWALGSAYPPDQRPITCHSSPAGKVCSENPL